MRKLTKANKVFLVFALTLLLSANPLNTVSACKGTTANYTKDTKNHTTINNRYLVPIVLKIVFGVQTPVSSKFGSRGFYLLSSRICNIMFG